MIFTNAVFPSDDELQATKIKKILSKIFQFGLKNLMRIGEKSLSNLIIDFWPILATTLDYFGSLWGPVWASWGSIWAALSAHWTLFCPLLAHLGAILVPLGYTLAYFGPSRAYFGRLQASFWSLGGPILEPKWTENPSSVRARRNARSD